MKFRLLAVCLAFLAAGIGQATALGVSIDDKAARAVLRAVLNPALTREQALAVAKLPGNQGLIRKIHAYGRKADDDMLADALLAAAQKKTTDIDKDFQFAQVRDSAKQIETTLDQLADPSTHALDEVKARIAMFSPAALEGDVAGFLIAGGTSGGFAFGKPEFFLNIMRFPSPKVAQTILEHEMYHGVQGLAGPTRPNEVTACVAKLPGGIFLAELLQDLYMEGTATYVGDVLLLGKTDDPVAEEQRTHLQTNVSRVKRSVTLMELSVHAIATSKISFKDIYGLGFYDDEILYALGYVMARAIAAEHGPGAIADLLTQPPSRFITAYVALADYAKSPLTPALGAETLLWARKVADCGW